MPETHGISKKVKTVPAANERLNAFVNSLSGLLPFLQRLYAAEQNIQVPSVEGTLLLKAGTVICLEGDRNYTNIYIKDQQQVKGYRIQLASYALHYFEVQLPPVLFFRACKGMVVGVNHITAIGGKKTFTLFGNCCSPVTISPEFCSDLRQLLTERGILQTL